MPVGVLLSTVRNWLRADQIRWLSPTLRKKYFFLFRFALEWGAFPPDFDFTNVVPGYKRNDSHDTNNYRYFMLIDTLCRVLGRLVARGLIDCIIEFVRYSCMGFVPGYGIDDVVAALRRMQENFGYAAMVVLGAIQLDFKQAFHSLEHKAILLALEAWGLTGKLGALVLWLLCVVLQVLHPLCLR